MLIKKHKEGVMSNVYMFAIQIKGRLNSIKWGIVTPAEAKAKLPFTSREKDFPEKFNNSLLALKEVLIETQALITYILDKENEKKFDFPAKLKEQVTSFQKENQKTILTVLNPALEATAQTLREKIQATSKILDNLIKDAFSQLPIESVRYQQIYNQQKRTAELKIKSYKKNQQWEKITVTKTQPLKQLLSKNTTQPNPQKKEIEWKKVIKQEKLTKKLEQAITNPLSPMRKKPTPPSTQKMRERWQAAIEKRPFEEKNNEKIATCLDKKKKKIDVSLSDLTQDIDRTYMDSIFIESECISAIHLIDQLKKNKALPLPEDLEERLSTEKTPTELSEEMLYLIKLLEAIKQFMQENRTKESTSEIEIACAKINYFLYQHIKENIFELIPVFQILKSLPPNTNQTQISPRRDEEIAKFVDDHIMTYLSELEKCIEETVNKHTIGTTLK